MPRPIPSAAPVISAARPDSLPAAIAPPPPRSANPGCAGHAVVVLAELLADRRVRGLQVHADGELVHLLETVEIDGETRTADEIVSELEAGSEGGGVRVFTIAYGADQSTTNKRKPRPIGRG